MFNDHFSIAFYSTFALPSSNQPGRNQKGFEQKATKRHSASEPPRSPVFRGQTPPHSPCALSYGGGLAGSGGACAGASGRMDLRVWKGRNTIIKTFGI